MARFVSKASKRNLIVYIWEEFSAQSTFAKMFIIIAILTLVAVPAIINNSQFVTQYAGSPEDFKSTIVLNPTENPTALGTYVTFSTNYPQNIFNPQIEVLCYQDNILVYSETGSVGDAFMLGGAGSKWLYETPETDAECKANLFYFGRSKGNQTYNRLATTSFIALGRQ